MPTIDSIEINSVLFQDPRNIQIDELHQTTKRQAFVYVDMYLTDRKGICTGLAQQVKCKVDCDAMANVMPLSIFKMLNPSEFDKNGNSISGFNRDMTRLSGYGIRPIQQHGVRLINFTFSKKYFKTRFHIVDVKGHVLLGLTLLRKMGMFHKHRLMIIETIDIYQEQRNLARYDSNVVDKCTMCSNERFSKSECQDKTSEEAEVVDVTEEWMESMRCIGNVLYDFQGPSHIHQESGIKSRPSISSRE